jgi:hypothetical protein
MSVDPKILARVQREVSYIQSRSRGARRVKLEKGHSCVVRFLPARLGPDKMWFARTAKHWLNKGPIVCPRETGEDFGGDPKFDCPVCTLCEELNADRNKDTADFGYDVSAKPMYLTYCVVWEKDGIKQPMDEVLQPYEFQFYQSTFEELNGFWTASLRRCDDGIFDYKLGNDFSIIRTKKGMRLDKLDSCAIFDVDDPNWDKHLKKLESALKEPRIQIPTPEQLEAFAEKVQAECFRGHRRDDDDERFSRSRQRDQDEPSERSSRDADEPRAKSSRRGEEEEPRGRSSREEEAPRGRSREDEPRGRTSRDAEAEPSSRSAREEEPRGRSRAAEEEPRERSRREDDEPPRGRREEEPRARTNGSEREEAPRGRSTREEEPRGRTKAPPEDDLDYGDNKRKEDEPRGRNRDDEPRGRSRDEADPERGEDAREPERGEERGEPDDQPRGKLGPTANKAREGSARVDSEDPDDALPPDDRDPVPPAKDLPKGRRDEDEPAPKSRRDAEEPPPVERKGKTTDAIMSRIGKLKNRE